MQSTPEEPRAPSDKMPPPSLGAIVLAAGQSTRFAQGNKLLAPFRGHPLIWSILNAVSGAKVAEVVLVTTEDIAQALPSMPLEGMSDNTNFRIAIHDPSLGLASSLKAGLLALSPSASGAMILLADMPLVSRAIITSLVSVYGEHDGKKIVFPANSLGQNGHPVLWPRQFFPQLMGVQGDRGAKGLLDVNKSNCVSIHADTDEAFVDVDTYEDLKRLTQR